MTSQTSSAPRPLSILIVDDEPVLCVFLGRLLKELGYQIAGTAGNGVEAVEMARELQPDLVILDNAMPVMNGLDAAGQILSEREVAIILCSGLVSAETHDQATRLGIRTLIPKPFTFGQLEVAVRGVESALTGALTCSPDMLPTAA